MLQNKQKLAILLGSFCAMDALFAGNCHLF